MEKLIFVCLLILFGNLQVQGQGTLLIISDTNCEITIDGEQKIALKQGAPNKVSLIAGDHIIQSKAGKKELMEFVVIEEGKQIMLKLDFAKGANPKEASSKETPTVSNLEASEYLLVSDINFTALGGVNSIVDETYDFSNPDLIYYAFEKGDEVLINADILNKKGKLYSNVYTYPDQNVIYSKLKIERLENHKIQIKKKGIYVIEIGTHAMFDKKMHLIIKRKPLSPEQADFNTNVVKRARFKTMDLNKTFFYVNSTSNETFKGGTNEVVFPVTIPPNAVEWYYSFSASRDEKEVKSNMNSASLLGDLTKVINGLNPTTEVINIGLNLLTKPPGANYCNVYLMDYTNVSAFRRDQDMNYIIEGSRENLKSSVVKINCCMDGREYYLGIENSDTYNGLHVGVEAVAILKEEYLDYE